MYDIKRIIEDVLQHNQNDGYFTNGPKLNDSQRRAVDLIMSAYESQGIGVVQGPPGTGKTTVVVKGIEELLSRLAEDKRVKLIYVAPTDKLVVDTYSQILRLMRFTDMNDVLRRTRIMAQQVGSDGIVGALRAPIDEDTEFIATTDYQLPRSRGSGFKYIMLVDEASKSPVYKFLTPVSLELVRAAKLGYKVSIESLIVVGDPMQAISIEELYRKKVDYLLMERLLRSILNDLGIDPDNLEESNMCRSVYREIINEETLSKLENFQMLNITYRLPSPSHEIISRGFYGGLLRAHYSTRDRVSLNDDTLARFHDCISNSKIAETIIDAVRDQIGIVYLHTREQAYNNVYGQNIDTKRAYMAIEAAILSSIATGKSTTILPVYRDMVNYIKFVMKTDNRYSTCLKKLEAVGIRINVVTAHAMLGSEDHNVVAVLGKEYLLDNISETKRPTLYFKEPEIFNVQFSRHKGLLVIVGNVERLSRYAKRQIRRFHPSQNSSSAIKQTLKRQLFCSSLMLSDSANALLELCGLEHKGNGVRLVRNTGMCEVVFL